MNQFRSQQNCGGCLGSLFGALIFLLVGGGLSYWGWTILQDARASESWPTVAGQVIRSEVTHSRDSDGDDSYRPHVNYSYVVNDLQYENNRIKFGENSYSKQQEANGIANRYPLGQQIAVYYDPAEPSSSILEPGVSGGSYIVLSTGAIFVFVSLIIIVTAPFANRRR